MRSEQWGRTLTTELLWLPSASAFSSCLLTHVPNCIWRCVYCWTSCTQGQRLTSDCWKHWVCQAGIMRNEEIAELEGSKQQVKDLKSRLDSQLLLVCQKIRHTGAACLAITDLAEKLTRRTDVAELLGALNKLSYGNALRSIWAGWPKN